VRSLLSRLFSRSAGLQPRAHRAHRAMPRLEVLEDRLAPATDIQVQAFSGAVAGTKIAIRYAILNEAAPSFKLQFFRSADDQWDAGDTLVSGTTISAASDLSLGVHTKKLNLGAGPGKIALPGAGAGDPLADYFLLAVADADDLVAESDGDAHNEDNTVAFRGSYGLRASSGSSGGPVMVHGSQDNEVITITNGQIFINSRSIPQIMSDVREYRVRSHGGNDQIRGQNMIARLVAFGGPGDDTILGSNTNDRLDGGDGNDVIKSGRGNDVFISSVGRDTLVPQGGADRIDWSVLLAAAASTTVSISFNARLPLAGQIEGCGAGGIFGVSAQTTLNGDGSLSGTFSARGSGSASCPDGCRVYFSGSATGVVGGSLGSVLVQGTAQGNVREVCPDGVDNEVVQVPFSLTANLTNDLLRVVVRPPRGRLVGRGEYTQIVTNA